MKAILFALILSLTIHAQADCNNGVLKVNKISSVENGTDMFEILITEPSFISEIKRKMVRGEVYFNCSGYCNNSESGWLTRSNNKLVSNTTLEIAQDGKETLKISEMRRDSDYYGNIYYFGKTEDSSSVKVRGNGMDVIIKSPSEAKGSHSYVRYELQHWYFDNCK